jgi:formamidopyrimidine-DNA glycosylase
MPELPEVETICRGLAGSLVGQRLVRVAVHCRTLRQPIPANFEQQLTGRVIERIGRRAKYMLIFLDDKTVVIGHLGMSGRMYVRSPVQAEPLQRHDHVVLTTADELTVVYHDPRRFGLLVLGRADALDKHELLKTLGPEPLEDDFTAARLDERLGRKPRSPLKAAQLDQTVVAGLGNIYVSEALHRAALSPERLAGTLNGRETGRLVKAIRSVLSDALVAGGSTLRDYVQADGEVGSFQNLFRVYDRDGRRCPRSGCRGVVTRLVQAGRSTYFCSQCQK